MDKIRLLQQRKQTLLNAGKKIRNDISALVDDQSFVELSAFSFSKNDFYGEEAEGEGVVCGFATIDGFSVYIVAQNFEVLSGGVSKANCDKICKCLDQAEKASAPVIYLISSLGVQVGEGINVLEGLAALLLKASQLKGSVPQYMIVNGEVYGQIAVLSALCDFTFFVEENSVLAVNSPLVLSAKSGQNLPKFKVGGVEGLTKTNLTLFKVKNLSDIKNKIITISNLLSERVDDCDNLNETIPELDKKIDYKTLRSVFDKDSIVEVGTEFCSEVKCLLGRIGGISVGAVIFDGDEVYLTAQTVRKIKDFAEFVSCYSLPYLNFVNTRGIKADLETNNSLILKEIADYISVVDCISTAKISVVYREAIGLGYTLFVAKNMGYDYSFAFANAKIALFDNAQGAEIEFADEDIDKNKLTARYSEENADPINAAKNGYIDNIIQPALVRQYLISALQILIK